MSLLLQKAHAKTRLTLRRHAALMCALALAACDSAAPSKEAAAPAAPEAAGTRCRRSSARCPRVFRSGRGDYPSLAERRAVRMLVVYSKTFYFIDKGQQRGITYDMGMELEKHLNANNKDKTRPIRVVFIPVARDQLLPALAAGVGDIATGGLIDHRRNAASWSTSRRPPSTRTSARSWSPRRM